MERKIFSCCLLLFFVNSTRILSKNATSDFEQLYDSIRSDIYERYFTDAIYNETDRQLIAQLYESEAVKNDPVYYARIQYLDAFIRCHDILDPHYEEVISLVDNSLKILTKQKYPQEYAQLLFLKGITCLKFNYLLVEAYQYLNESLSLLDKNNETSFVESAYNRLGKLWLNLEEYDNALEYCLQSEEIARTKHLEKDVHYIELNIATIFSGKGDYLQSIQRIRQGIPWAENHRDSTLLAYQYKNLGENFIRIHQPDSALYYLQKALLITGSHTHLVIQRSEILVRLGKLFFAKEELKKSVDYLEQSLQYLTDSTRIDLQSDIYFMKYQIQKKTGNDREAYKNLEKSVELKNTLALQERMRDAHNKKSRVELIKYQEQLKITEQKAKTKQAYILLITFILLFIVLFILYYINHKKKLKELENEQLLQQLKNEEINNQLNKLHFEKQIEEKEREMLTTKLLITEKNKMYEQLLKNFKPFYEAGDISEKIWNELNRFAKTQLQKDDHWAVFKMHFDRVHSDFYKKLKEISPHLTENELRICAYILIGIEAKQIANMLSVNHRSIITCRYRIRKKLQLGEDDLLDNFIRNL
ncbi:MAG: hypothetical protein LBO74_11325 [Candidatus Symbiothrix sp.]|nr:hypothetical protein [Candidatus Symbiothrix sp.]